VRLPPPLFSAKDQDTIRVADFGDFGTGTDEQKEVASAMMTSHRQSPFDIGITLGDNFYPVGMESPTDPRWQTWWEDVYGQMKLTFYGVSRQSRLVSLRQPRIRDSLLPQGIKLENARALLHLHSRAHTVVCSGTREVSAKQLRWLNVQS
jgi:hypothetical protein